MNKIKNQKSELPKLIDIHELCQQLGIKESKCRSMIFKDEIPYLKIGRLIRFNQREIEGWLKQLKK